MATCTDLIVCHFQEIKSAQEAEIQNREEVGMDLDDEASNLGGLIEQPALQVAQEQRQEEDESLAPAAAKKLCSDASGNSAQLHCQDIDFANSNFFSGQVGFSWSTCTYLTSHFYSEKEEGNISRLDLRGR